MPDLPILIVEDEPAMREGLRDNLEFEGYTVEVAPDGQAGLDKMTANAYRLVLLDVMMPRRSGFEVLREARAAGVKTPVIVLTAKSQEVDAVRGLEMGADDFVTKPFGLSELMARVRAVLRRVEGPAESDIIEVGRLRLDLSSYEAAVDGQAVAMTHLEAEVLRHFAAHSGQIVTRDQLLDAVWGDDVAPTTRTVDNFVLKLRQKAEPDPSRPRHFVTVHGVGYKFLP
ncbi:response regulator transcription factor [Rubrivirga sp.]|uniref:response regulator transcription factor n=1 Tax=Rubrivirga sp. TaxID=1885344 RepID=UPI003C75F341